APTHIYTLSLHDALPILALASFALLGRAFAGLPIIVASDSGSDPAYSPQPDNDYNIDNGGFGYNTWTTVTTSGGGGTYMDGVGRSEEHTAELQVPCKLVC